MRVLCDENVPLAVERVIVAAGHNVVAVRDRSPGVADTVVLQLALEENRLLITYDRDFGTLIFRDRLTRRRFESGGSNTTSSIAELVAR